MEECPSKIFLEEAARQITARNGRLINVDAMLIAEAPKIAPHVAAMKANIAAALGVSPNDIGIKAPPTKPWASSAAEKVWPRTPWPAWSCPTDGQQRRYRLETPQ